jgi:hypothetical protein
MPAGGECSINGGAAGCAPSAMVVPFRVSGTAADNRINRGDGSFAADRAGDSPGAQSSQWTFVKLTPEAFDRLPEC